MANFVPKIEYGSPPVTITFELPPEGDNLKEKETANIKTTFSTNGTEQSQFNYITQNISPKFVFVTQAKIDELRILFETHALQGQNFKYFESNDEIAFITVTLAKKEFNPVRVFPDDSGGFVHDIIIPMRRTI